MPPPPISTEPAAQLALPVSPKPLIEAPPVADGSTGKAKGKGKTKGKGKASVPPPPPPPPTDSTSPANPIVSSRRANKDGKIEKPPPPTPSGDAVGDLLAQIRSLKKSEDVEEAEKGKSPDEDIVSRPATAPQLKPKATIPTKGKGKGKGKEDKPKAGSIAAKQAMLSGLFG
eukprot:SAG31_NODE_10862_length_1089_cov_1.260606_1_plen_172_part_00